MHTQSIKNYRSQNQKEIESIQAALADKPEGKLTWSRDHNHYKWFNSLGKTSPYIKKSNPELAVQLAEKNVLMARLKDLETEQKAFDYYIKKCSDCGKQLKKYLSEKSPIPGLLQQKYKTKSDIIKHWLDEPYDTNPKHPESLIHKSVNGLLVRSKSEAMIVAELLKYNVPFRYECKLSLRNGVIYPDFTIMHPESLKLFYWEHFGLMDDPEYIRHATNKITGMAEEGIILNINLFTTSETAKEPLGYEMIDQTIEMILSRG